MNMFSSFNINASGMTAQRKRMDIVSTNIANVDTTRTEEGGPYRRKMPVFRERGGQTFVSILRGSSQGEENGAELSAIAEDQKPFKLIHNPTHPDANEDGYVEMPNVDITTEMVDMIDASRAYEANVTAMNTLKNMATKALEIGRG
ncbi:MAG: flagellar basal body rod protein FlgC [Halanaerobiales bacterium]